MTEERGKQVEDFIVITCLSEREQARRRLINFVDEAFNTGKLPIYARNFALEAIARGRIDAGGEEWLMEFIIHALELENEQ